MTLHLIKSNRTEILLDELAGVVRTPLAAPLVPETIVVQSRGMQRWLAMQLAARLGVWANCRYPFPNALIDELLTLVVGKAQGPALFSRETLTWRTMALIPEVAARPEGKVLARYLSGSDSERRLFQVAGTVADLYDQYTLFRPDLLTRWEKGKEKGWQPELWRRLTAGCPARHRGQLRAQFHTLGPVVLASAALPERLSLFGISYLPPFHLEALAELARVCEVYMFLLTPCREYWGDLRPRETGGNPLLASFGRLGREFGEQLLAVEAPVEELECFAEIAGPDLLALVQTDILTLRDRGEGEPTPLPAAAVNIQFHVCHSPLREAEVLKDQLLALLQADPQLLPEEILVMTPDIEGYAPAITAVFGASDGSPSIPFAIADRNFRHEQRLADALLALLQLAGGRVTVCPVVDLLEVPAVRRCFGLAESDLVTIRDWLAASRVRWGLDEADRAAAGFPPYGEHSWRAGLDRLLLGLALAPGGEQWGEILPAADLTGDQARLLGRFADYIDWLTTAITELRRPAKAAAWAARLQRLAREFLCPYGEEESELADLLTSLNLLSEAETVAGYDRSLSLAIVTSWLRRRLEGETGSRGFLAGGVTFAALLPMRSIPFKVVALIGMNDGVFPRRDRAPGFDLMAAERRPGDRSLRDEDRYLFLEAFLSARQHLHVSYVGQSARDGSEIPPAVPVSELLEYLRRGFVLADGEEGTLVNRLVTSHRLQPFSHDYFVADGPLFTFDPNLQAAMVAMQGGRCAPPPFLAEPLPPPEPGPLAVSDLLRCFANPARFFLERRLGLTLRSPRAAATEREPFSVDGLDAYGLQQQLVTQLLAGADPEPLRRRVRADGLLPPGRQGEVAFADLLAKSAAFADQVRAATGPLPAAAAVDVHLRLGETLIIGAIADVHPGLLLRHRPAKLAARDQLGLWLEFLLLTAVAADSPDRALLVMRDKAVSFRRPDDPLVLLETFSAAYHRAQTLPLPFFPATSLAFVEGGNWRLVWEGSDYLRGDGMERAVDICFAHADPMGAEFRELAVTLLEPLLAHREEEK
jgi:exodeoxyribonuclease V gamma subunit